MIFIAIALAFGVIFVKWFVCQPDDDDSMKPCAGILSGISCVGFLVFTFLILFPALDGGHPCDRIKYHEKCIKEYDAKIKLMKKHNMPEEGFSHETAYLVHHKQRLVRVMVEYPNIKPADYSWWRPCDAPYIIGDLIREYDDDDDDSEGSGIVTVAQDWVVNHWNTTSRREAILYWYVLGTLITGLLLSLYLFWVKSFLGEEVADKLDADIIFNIGFVSVLWPLVLYIIVMWYFAALILKKEKS